MVFGLVATDGKTLRPRLKLRGQPAGVRLSENPAMAMDRAIRGPVLAITPDCPGISARDRHFKLPNDTAGRRSRPLHRRDRNLFSGNRTFVLLQTKARSERQPKEPVRPVDRREIVRTFLGLQGPTLISRSELSGHQHTTSMPSSPRGS
jgi:hypothetical protein